VHTVSPELRAATINRGDFQEPLVGEQPPNLRHYGRVIRRQGWLIATVVAFALATAAFVSHRQSPVYRASTSVVVGQGGGVFAPQFGNSVQPFVETMASLLQSQVVAAAAISTLHLSMTPNQLLSGLNVTTTPDSSVLTVTYDSGDRVAAPRILAAIAGAFADLVSRRLGGDEKPSSRITATVFDPAHVQPGEVSPHPTRNLGIAVALGLAVGLVLAFVRDSLTSRIRGQRDAERWFGAPVLATLPRTPRPTRMRAGLAPAPNLEALGMVRAGLQYLDGAPAGPVLTVTSASRQEGKTRLVASLALELASAGHSVICVEADLHHPQLCEYLNLRRPDRGLTDILADARRIEEVVVPVPTSTGVNGDGHAHKGNGSGPEAGTAGEVSLIAVGRRTARGSDLLTLARVKRLVDDLRARAEYVLFDTDPILSSGDVFPFARASDNVIVVARADRTTREAAEAAGATLERLGVQRVSVVLLGPASHARSLL
jgi:capsular polysaccharide biosynthesis protein/Mrp family chromosome partitioning ATPase